MFFSAISHGRKKVILYEPLWKKSMQQEFRLIAYYFRQHGLLFVIEEKKKKIVRLFCNDIFEH